ncbi:MAG: alanine racemase, partial [Oscillospiraceae bacterium]|nr:alanine racemase [Oscillospiraceae bacterium]
MHYNSYLEVNLTQIKANAAAVQKSLPPGVAVIPVLKNDAYGMGMTRVFDALRSSELRFTCVGAAHLSEGEALRRHLQGAGRKCDILLLGAVPNGLESRAVSAGLIPSLSSPQQAERFARAVVSRHGGAGRRPVQIEINTGLNRFGAKPGTQLALLAEAIIAHPQLEVTGAFAHMSLLDV